MPVYKRQYRNGRVVWSYEFAGPESSRENRTRITATGFATRKAAVEAEAERRLEIQQQALEQARDKAPEPLKLGAMIRQWHADQCKNWSPKTAQRYIELAAYLSPELTRQPITEVTALMLHHEWERLSASGGHTRNDKTPRPLSPKTVRNIAGTVSSAYSWGILYGMCASNPVSKSKPPRGGARRGISLSPSQQDLMAQSAGGPWCLGAFLEVCAALGVRRGEALALRWADIVGSDAFVSRSLCQVKSELTFKAPKSGKARRVEIPASTLAVLEAHRAEQNKYREQFGSDYQGDLIFANLDGTPLRPDSVSSAVSALCKRLKLSGASLHTLRHSHGSQLAAGGVPIAEIAERLGHSSTATTLAVYSHAVPGRSEAAKKWDEFQQHGSTLPKQ